MVERGLHCQALRKLSRIEVVSVNICMRCIFFWKTRNTHNRSASVERVNLKAVIYRTIDSVDTRETQWKINGNRLKLSGFVQWQIRKDVNWFHYKSQGKFLTTERRFPPTIFFILRVLGAESNCSKSKVPLNLFHNYWPDDLLFPLDRVCYVYTPKKKKG